MNRRKRIFRVLTLALAFAAGACAHSEPGPSAESEADTDAAQRDFFGKLAELQRLKTFEPHAVENALRMTLSFRSDSDLNFDIYRGERTDEAPIQKAEIRISKKTPERGLIRLELNPKAGLIADDARAHYGKSFVVSPASTKRPDPGVTGIVYRTDAGFLRFDFRSKEPELLLDAILDRRQNPR